MFAGSTLNAQWVLEVEIDGDLERFPVGTAAFGPQVTDTLTAPALIGMDGSDQPQLGCEPLTTDLSGAFGLLRRGDCTFKQKALNAQNAGAIALIVCNTLDELVTIPDDGDITEEITIQTVSLSSSDCRVIRDAVNAGSDVSISLYEIPLAIVWGGPDDPNSTFDGGLNDWTTVGIRCSNDNFGNEVDAANAQWEWVANPVSLGAYAGTTPMVSPSASNGAVIFDSDLLDNTGIPNAFMTGDCPAPQTAQLISPMMDLSGFPAVALTFYQNYRVFGGPGGGPGGGTASFVEVSGDGGENWTRFPVNEDIEVNSATSNPNRVALDISEVAGDRSEVQVRFVWDGDYYFWIIDDVEVVELPEVNLAIENAFFPLTSVCIPARFAPEQEMEFEVQVSNVGGADQNIEAIVQVVNINTDEIYFTETQQIANLERGTDTTVTFQNSFSSTELIPGDYIVNYRVRTPGEVDFDPSTNVISYFFRISEDIYANEDCAQLSGFGGLRATGVFTWYWGNAFYIGDLSGSDGSSEVFFTGGQGSLFLQGDSEWTNESVFMHLLKFNEPGKDAFNNFNTEVTDEPIAHPDLTPVALAVVTPDLLNQVGNGNLFEVSFNEFFLVDGSPADAPIALEQGHYYFLFLQLDEDQVEPFMFVSQNSGNITAAEPRELLHLGDGYGLFQEASRRPVIRMRVDITNNTTETELAQEKGFLIYPVPANNELNIELDLPQLKDVSIEMYDVQGRLINRSVHPNAGTEIINKNVSEFKSGNYLIRIITEDGVQTQQVIIVR